MDILDILPAQTSVFTVYLNTGTLLDLACGAVLETRDHFTVNGGLSNIVGIGGRSQTYKSSIMDGLIARAMSIYTDVQCVVFDTENSKPGIDRYDDLAMDGRTISDRIRLYDTTTDDLNSFHDKIKSIVDYKKKHLKEMMVETPFIDEHTHRPITMPIPTIIAIDSFTMAGANSETESIEDNALDDSALNTIWMKSGKNKTLFMLQLVQYARATNIYFVLTAHVGDNMAIGTGPMAHPVKQLQYMKQNDRLKNVGSQFQFLTNTFLQTQGVSTLTTSDGKECYYPAGFPNPIELNRVNISVVRNKINASGTMVPFVVSQYEGLMNTLTYVQYLKDQKAEELLVQKGANMSPTIYPDSSFTRKSIRERSQSDKRLQRALEISAQFLYLKHCWSNRIPVDLSLSIEHFVERLTADTTIMHEVLDSRGYWTYSQTDTQYLSIFDIVDRIHHSTTDPVVVDMSPRKKGKASKESSSAAPTTLDAA